MGAEAWRRHMRASRRSRGERRGRAGNVEWERGRGTATRAGRGRRVGMGESVAAPGQVDALRLTICAEVRVCEATSGSLLLLRRFVVDAQSARPSLDFSLSPVAAEQLPSPCKHSAAHRRSQLSARSECPRASSDARERGRATTDNSDCTVQTVTHRENEKRGPLTRRRWSRAATPSRGLLSRRLLLLARSRLPARRSRRPTAAATRAAT